MTCTFSSYWATSVTGTAITLNVAKPTMTGKQPGVLDELAAEHHLYDLRVIGGRERENWPLQDQVQVHQQREVPRQLPIRLPGRHREEQRLHYILEQPTGNSCCAISLSRV